MTPPVRLVLILAALATVAGCSRNDDKAATSAAGTAASSANAEAAPVAGGPPKPMRPGLWKTTARTAGGAERTTTQCIGEGQDPAAIAAQDTPCGKPQVTPVIDGFTIELACTKDNIAYSLAGVVKGDFETRTTSTLEMIVKAYGVSKTMKLDSESVYVGPCEAAQGSPPPRD
ncbi:DUF3617 domain-containing protein [Caulobacter hibisci]|uniref:DUF3617 family protein n=1 Tax=Caulobacter hibisci TaxID=2035993 RepID=A0ABS0SRK6_9CAUL|nr:DUF3617 family protein [Caulobacter hibisci]MBI1682240.1 hypothetical protein [Caulobacter hibisci]